MNRYALIKNDVVVNIIVWDGVGDMFTDFMVVNIDNELTGIGWTFDRGSFLPPPEPELTPQEHLVEAERYREGLLRYANDVISDWRTELSLGIISDEDKQKLILWMQYIKDVLAVDTATAPAIDWPKQPG